MYAVDVVFSNALRMRLTKVDIKLVVTRDNRKFGELHISKGAVDWRSRSDQHSRRANWNRLARLIEASGLPKKRISGKPLKAKRVKTRRRRPPQRG